MNHETFFNCSPEDKIRYICSYLVQSRYLPAMEFVGAAAKGVKERSFLYAYALDNFNEISRRLEDAGFALTSASDGQYIEAFPAVMPFNEAPTREKRSLHDSKILIGIEMLYERGKNDIGRFGTVDCNLQDLIILLTQEFRAFDKEPKKADLVSALSSFERSSLIRRQGGSWSEGMTKFTILPCIQSVVPPEAVQAFETAYANAVDSTEELFASIMEEDVDSKGKTVEFDESEADGGQ